MKPYHWQGKTNGGGRAQKALQFFFRFFGMRMGYFFAALALPFFMLANRKGYFAIYDYAHHILQKNKLRSFYFVFVNHYRFAQSMLDRAALSVGKKSAFSYEFIHAEKLDQLIQSSNSAIIGGVHFGNFELVPYIIPDKTKLFRPVIFEENDEALKQTRPVDKIELQMQAIVIREDMSHIFDIHQAIKQGDFVSMTVDRMYEGMKSYQLPILGKQAEVPVGAFHLAVQFELPLLSVLAVRTKKRHYKIFVDSISLTEEEKLADKQQKTQILCTKFWKKIEEYLESYPEQWYDFFPFWEIEKHSTK